MFGRPEGRRWRSPAMPGRYARGQLAARGAVARLRYSACPPPPRVGCAFRVRPRLRNGPFPPNKWFAGVGVNDIS